MNSITMRYVTTAQLQREFGLTRGDAAAIIRAETARVRWRHRYRIAAVTGLLLVALASTSAPDSAPFNHASQWLLLAGVVAAVAINTLTRCQAQPAILAAARAAARKG